MKIKRGKQKPTAAYWLNMYRLVPAIGGVVIAAIVGCVGPLVKIEEIDLSVASRVEVIRDKSILQKENVNKLGIVEATSCKHLLWHPDSSIENCTDQLKMKASRLGGNAIVFGSSEGRNADFLPETGVNRNCWNTVDCSAVVILRKPN
ncbi:MAG: hypothetical protein H0X01_02295 [Nitrospira sp.]|nr:hypothetical protein [Nitrospira sp.]